MNKHYKLLIFFSIFLFVGINLVNASETETVKILNTTIHNGTVEGFSELAVAVFKWILGVTGSVALLAFVIGGAMMLASAGNAQMVERGKQTLVGAVIGIVIVFGSWLMVKYVTEGLGGTFKAGVETKTTTGESTAAEDAAEIEKTEVIAEVNSIDVVVDQLLNEIKADQVDQQDKELLDNAQLIQQEYETVKNEVQDPQKVSEAKQELTALQQKIIELKRGRCCNVAGFNNTDPNCPCQ